MGFLCYDLGLKYKVSLEKTGVFIFWVVGGSCGGLFRSFIVGGIFKCVCLEVFFLFCFILGISGLCFRFNKNL